MAGGPVRHGRGCPEDGAPGNGLLLFFRVNDFEATLARARALVGRLEKDPRVNPFAGKVACVR